MDIRNIFLLNVNYLPTVSGATTNLDEMKIPYKRISDAWFWNKN